MRQTGERAMLNKSILLAALFAVSTVTVAAKRGQRQVENNTQFWIGINETTYCLSENGNIGGGGWTRTNDLRIMRTQRHSDAC
jgi:hypothetical protein